LYNAEVLRESVKCDCIESGAHPDVQEDQKDPGDLRGLGRHRRFVRILVRRPVTVTVVFVSTDRAFVRRRQRRKDLAATRRKQLTNCDRVRLERLRTEGRWEVR